MVIKILLASTWSKIVDFNAGFMDFISAPQDPLIHGLEGGLNFHSMDCWDKEFTIQLCCI